MESESFNQLYSTKTDDELLALGADPDSLTPEARSVLANELARRGLTERSHSAPVEADATLHLEENPAFNAPAKVAYIVLAIFIFGSLAFYLSIIVSEDSDWKRVVSRFTLLMLPVWVPIFAAIAWATRRNLKNARTSSRKRKR